jgi:hypothetical protein
MQASDPAIHESFLELAKALRAMAGQLTSGSGLSDPEIQRLAERMTGKTTDGH